MLGCSSGISTSLLVTEVQATAADNIKATIFAIPESQILNEIDKCDVLLLGPQVRFMLSKAEEIARPKNIPVQAINMMHYGTSNGNTVLARVIELSKK